MTFSIDSIRNHLSPRIGRLEEGEVGGGWREWREGIITKKTWEKDDAAVNASFMRQRTTFNDDLKERSRLEESKSSSCDAGTTKPQAETQGRGKAKAKARIKEQPA